MKRILMMSMLMALLVSVPVGAHEGHNKAFGTQTVTANVGQKIVIAPEGREAIGLQTQAVTKAPLVETLRLTGEVTHADERLAELTAPLPGLVKALYVKEGDTVRKGQTVATLQSPEAMQLLTDLLQQKASLDRELAVFTKEQELATITLEREDTLLKEGISPRKDWQAAKNAVEVAKANVAATRRQKQVMVNAAKSQLRLLGLSEGTINSTIVSGNVPSSVAIVSPINGTVANHDVTLGETVDTTKKLFTIVSLQPIWIFIDVPQEQVNQIHVGQSVTLTTPSGDTTSGTIDSVGKMVDPDKRTLPVRIESPNAAETLKPGLFVTADVALGKALKDGVILPQEAVVDDNGKALVFVDYGTYFQPVTVTKGRTVGEQVEVLDGLYTGDKVVIQGANQLWAQRLIASSTEGASSSSSQSNAPEIPWLWIALAAIGGLVVGVASGRLWPKKAGDHHAQ